MTKKIVGINGGEISTRKAAPKVVAVHPFGSKILVEVLEAEDLLDTSLFIPEGTESDGAPQAYIIEMGPQVNPDCGLKVGQRVYWSGKGTAVADPRQTKRTRALLEVHNIQGIIEERSE
jgi:co-chaperonin GroES (HSP10)